MRIATYNVEWFDALFDNDGNPLADGEWSSRRDVTRAEQLDALGKVFQTIDADAVLVVEAPDTNKQRSTERALENFARLFGLRTSKALTGFTNNTQQELALLYDPTKLSARHAPVGDPTGKHGAQGAPRFDGVLKIDLDIDAAQDQVRFSKPPLEAVLETPSGDAIRLIGVHVKSKAPHGASNAKEVMRIAIQNRRKQLAQCIWLRRRVETHLENGENLVVLGDFNDGPGLDEYEKLFGRSGLEIVLGEGEDTKLFDPHAHQALTRRLSAAPTTARFYIRHEDRYLQALLDYIMVSPSLRARSPKWRIWHPFEDRTCFDDKDMCAALLTASDHFPVSMDLPTNSQSQ